MQTSEFLHFTSEFKYVNLDELNNAFSNFYNKYCDSSAIGRELFSFEYKLKEFVNCMDYNIQKIKDNQYYPNFHALMEIDNFHNIIFKSLLKLFKTDDLILLEKLCCNIKIIISKYKHLFSYRLIKNPCHKDEIQQVKINDYDSLLTKIFEYVKHRNDSIEKNKLSYYENFDIFDFKPQLIKDFIKYAFHDLEELENYHLFLKNELIEWNQNNPTIFISESQLESLIKGEQIKFSTKERTKFFVQSEKEKLLNKIKKEVFEKLKKLGLQSNYESFVLIFDFNNDFYKNPLVFNNPKNIPISFIIKFLIENKFISDKIRFEYKTKKTSKSPKGTVKQTFAEFSKSFNASAISKSINYKSLEKKNYIMLENNDFSLDNLVILIEQYTKLT